MKASLGQNPSPGSDEQGVTEAEQQAGLPGGRAPEGAEGKCPTHSRSERRRRADSERVRQVRESSATEDAPTATDGSASRVTHTWVI